MWEYIVRELVAEHGVNSNPFSSRNFMIWDRIVIPDYSAYVNHTEASADEEWFEFHAHTQTILQSPRRFGGSNFSFESKLTFAMSSTGSGVCCHHFERPTLLWTADEKN